YGALGTLAIVGAVGMAAVLAHRIHRGELDLGFAQGTAARARMILPGRVGALVEKDLRAAWRDPALRAPLFVGLLGPLIFLFFLTRTGSSTGSGSAFLLLASFVGLSGFGANVFGLERRGVALLMGFPLPRWQVLVAKNLASMALRLPGILTLLLAGLV